MIEPTELLRLYVSGMRDAAGAASASLYVLTPSTGLAGPVLIHEGPAEPVPELASPAAALDYVEKATAGLPDDFGHGSPVVLPSRVPDASLIPLPGTWGTGLQERRLIVARDADPGRTERLAERIRSTIEAKNFGRAEGLGTQTTCSIGFACYPFHRADPEALSWEQVLAVADCALYAAKVTRNAWVGYIGADTNMSGEQLYRAIREEPEALRSQGGLTVRNSRLIAGRAN